MTSRPIWINLGLLGALMALMGLIYWQHTGARAVPGLMADLRSDDRQAQTLAALHLKQIGSAAKPAVPLLVELATSSGTSALHGEAASTLPFIDLSAARQVMIHYMPTLQDPDSQMRREAVSSLGALGPVAKSSVPSLFVMLDDPDTIVRDRVVRALGSIGLPPDMVVQGLIQALHDPEWTVRHAAVAQFAFSGYAGPQSLSVLQELTKDSNRTVAQLARSAVASAQRPIPVSVHLLTLSQPVDRTYTLLQLVKLGPRASEAVPKLTTLLSSEFPLERFLAARALEAIGPAAKGAVEGLRRSIRDSDPIVREAVAEALQAIEIHRQS